MAVYPSLRWRHASFYAGWLTLALALVSPIHELGEQLFSAHMLQHEILILVSAPLISAAHPGATMLWAFAPGHRVNLGGWVHAIERSTPIAFLTRPLVAWLLEASALWIWHIPVLYQATLTSDWIHAAQHLSFFVTAVLFWSALYGVGRSAMSYGALPSTSSEPPRIAARLERCSRSPRSSGIPSISRPRKPGDLLLCRISNSAASSCGFLRDWSSL